MPRVRLVSLGTGRELDVPEDTTVSEVARIADLSPDLELRFNGERARGSERVRQGDQISAVAPSVKHGVPFLR